MKANKNNLKIILGLGSLTLGRMLYDPFPGNSLDGILAAEATWFLMLGNQVFESIISSKNKLIEIGLVLSPVLLGSGIEYLQHTGYSNGTGDIKDIYAYLIGSTSTYVLTKVMNN